MQHIAEDVLAGTLSPVDVLRAHGKRALEAHRETNCLTEIMIPEAERWSTNEVNLTGPLAGIPVTLKDSVHVRGFDTSVGYSRYTGQPQQQDGVMVRLLKQAGAVPVFKTNVPISLLSFESTNDVWGRTTNPHNKDYSPGGSTGGEAALLAYGGSRFGIGSDVAGSVRVPAHFSGCYSLRCSTGRWPKTGVNTSMPGQMGIESVFSPMARTLNDLNYFTKTFIKMRPWQLDHTVLTMEWRDNVERDFREQEKFCIGVMRSDGVVPPSPACARALEETVAALEAEGHELVEVDPPSPYEGLQLASLLLNADGCRTFWQLARTGEWMDKGAAQMHFYMALPRPLKYLWYLWVRYVRGDEIWAGLLRDFHPKTAAEQWQLMAKREAYKARWHAWWHEHAKMDFMLTPPNATPAVPHDGMHDAVSSCGYTFLFNILDYTCGIVPVTRVSRKLDALPASLDVSKMNGVARGAYKHYDADKMHGLPVGVQVVGQRLQEEKVLAVMDRVEEALDKHNGGKYELLNP